MPTGADLLALGTDIHARMSADGYIAPTVSNPPLITYDLPVQPTSGLGAAQGLDEYNAQSVSMGS